MAITEDRQLRADVFRNNFRRLLAHHWLSQRVLADALGVRYKWIRRLASKGLVHSDKRTAINLKAIADHFGIALSDLWDTNLKLEKSLRNNWVLFPWLGSKRKQAQEILSHFPRQIQTYHEPFIGGGSMFKALLESDIEVQRYRLSDRCRPLIGIWKLVKNDPRLLVDSYEQHWSQFQVDPKKHFHSVRDKFNESHDPCLFFFLLRTCRIGMPRFNQRGEFTTACHYGVSGSRPTKVERVVRWWNERLRDIDVQFRSRDFERVETQAGDFLYLDPPYDVEGRYYYGDFDFDRFFRWLRRQNGLFSLSMDKQTAVPSDLYDNRLLIENGSSVTKRLVGGSELEMVDALYMGG